MNDVIDAGVNALITDCLTAQAGVKFAARSVTLSTVDLLSPLAVNAEGYGVVNEHATLRLYVLSLRTDVLSVAEITHASDE